MFKKMMLSAWLVLIGFGSSIGFEVGDTKYLWVHNFQFFQYDYKIGATLQATGDHCHVWVENNLITAIVVDQDNQMIYAGTKVSGIFRKTTNSNSWEPFSEGLPQSSRSDGLSRVHNIVITDKGTLIAATDEGVYRLTTSNTRWSRTDVRNPVFSLIQSNGVLYAGLGGYLWADDPDEDSDVDIDMGIFISTNDGVSWNRQCNGLPYDNDDEYFAVYDLTKTDQGIFATTEAGVFMKPNGETYWKGIEKTLAVSKATIKTNIMESLLDETELQTIGKSFGSIFERLLAAEGISREDKLVVVEYDSVDQIVRKWSCPANDIPDTDNLYPMRNKPGIVGDEGKFTVRLNYYTRDPETPFIADYSTLELSDFQYRGEEATATIVDPQEELMLIVTSPLDPDFEVGGKFVTITYIDEGDTLVWSEKTVTFRGLNDNKKGVILSNDNLIKGEPLDNYDRLNDANILNRMELSTSSNLVMDEMGYSYDDAILYAGSTEGVYKSTDHGKTWTLVGYSETGLENTSVISFATKNGIVYAGTLDGIFKSQDQGVTWSPLKTIEEDIAIITILPGGNDVLYTGTPFGFFKSDDGGDSWCGYNLQMAAYATSEQVALLIKAFEDSTPVNADQGIYKIITDYFGEENIPDFDQNPKINIVLTNILEKGESETTSSNGQNGITPLYGYIRSQDQSYIGMTNQGEYIYIDSKESDDTQRGSALAHNLLNMMIWNNDYDEEKWIVEGLCFYAEKICGYSLPTAMPDFQSLIGASSVFSLVAGIPLSPWAVDAENGQMTNRYTMVTMFTTYLFENFGGDELIKSITAEPENGWRGVENALGNGDVKFTDVFAAWTVANAINDPIKIDPITGAQYGYEDSVYSRVLNNYMDLKGLGMNWSALFLHNASMSDYKEYKVSQEYRDGLNNWASIIRYFFPDPGVADPVQSVVNYMDRDLETGEPIFYRMNAGDQTSLKVQLIKVKPTGEMDIENITPTFNSEKELSFNILSKYEPNADTTELKYYDLYVLISNQDTLGGAAKFTQVKDDVPPDVDYQIIHNPLYPEFLEIYIVSNEHLFYDVGEEFEGPTVEMVYFADSTTIEMEIFDTVTNKKKKEILYVYKGRYHITEEGEVTLVMRKLQDCGGNDAENIQYPISLFKVTPQLGKTITSSDQKTTITIPSNSIRKPIFVSMGALDAKYLSQIEDKKALNENQIVGKIYQIGPAGQTLDNKAELTLCYDNIVSRRRGNGST